MFFMCLFCLVYKFISFLHEDALENMSNDQKYQILFTNHSSSVGVPDQTYSSSQFTIWMQFNQTSSIPWLVLGIQGCSISVHYALRVVLSTTKYAFYYTVIVFIALQLVRHNRKSEEDYRISVMQRCKTFTDQQVADFRAVFKGVADQSQLHELVRDFGKDPQKRMDSYSVDDFEKRISFEVALSVFQEILDESGELKNGYSHAGFLEMGTRAAEHPVINTGGHETSEKRADVQLPEPTPPV